MTKSIVVIGILWLLADLSQEVNVNQVPSFQTEAAQVNPHSSLKPLPKLDCSFELTPGQHLQVKVKVSNQSGADIFVLNRLWDLNSSNQIVADAQDVYRFVRGSELRLLWGIAPPPRLKTVTYRNIPFATPLKAGASLEWEQAINLPMKEYSVYFPESAKTVYQPVGVNRVVIIVDFVEAQPHLATTPSPLAPALKVSTPEALDSHRSISCSSAPMRFEVLRRTDEFDRLTLPNENPEPLVLPK